MRLARLRFIQEWAGPDDPAPSAPGRHAYLLEDLLGSAADLRREVGLDVVMAFVKQVPCGASGMGCGRSIGIESNVPFSSSLIVAVRVVIESDQDTPAPSERTALH
jgi:hypothetical protein